MARRSEASPPLRSLILLLALIAAAVVWITASKSESPSSKAVTAKPTEDSVVKPSQAAAVAPARTTALRSTPTPTVVTRASKPSRPEAQTSEAQDEALAAIDVPLTLPTFDNGRDAFPAMTGMRAVLDPVTGKLTVPSEEQRRRMGELMKGYWPVQDDQPLVGQTFANGGEIVNLDDRYTEFVVIERGPDGKLRTRHVSGSQPPVAGTAGAAPGDR